MHLAPEGGEDIRVGGMPSMSTYLAAAQRGAGAAHLPASSLLDLVSTALLFRDKSLDQGRWDTVARRSNEV